MSLAVYTFFCLWSFAIGTTDHEDTGTVLEYISWFVLVVYLTVCFFSVCVDCCVEGYTAVKYILFWVEDDSPNRQLLHMALQEKFLGSIKL